MQNKVVPQGENKKLNNFGFEIGKTTKLPQP